jgi:peptide/nickel transport system permease protein
MSRDPQAPLSEIDRIVEPGLPYVDAVGGTSTGVGRRTALSMRRVFRNRGALVGTVILVILVAASVLASVLSSRDPTAVLMSNYLLPPGGAHTFGTDQYGRDVLSRLIGAARVAAEAVLIVVAIGGIVGTVLGGLAGLFGGVLDGLVSRAVEVVQGFPIVLLAIAIVAISGPSLIHAMLAVGIGAIPDFARVARSVALQLRSREFVQAARSIGSSELRILRTEILPNMVGALLVIASFDGAQAVMWEAALSFLGLGVQPPQPSFGGMLSDAKSYLALQPWYAIVTGIALAAVILGLNLIGDALSDYYDRGGRR